MKIFGYLDQMLPYIAEANWSGLEIKYHAVAAKLAGKEQAERIAKVDFSRYQTNLQKALAKAIRGANQSVNTKALYFEYDLDNNWQSEFFLCTSYDSESIGNDWACDWEAAIEGPDFPLLTKIYNTAEGTFDASNLARGVTLYLIARTVATFGRCADQHPDFKLPICIGFHDQDPIMRIRDVVR
ncbi:MAG TPA: hypothetical protein VNO70_13500 [Blastocatellia bacterium]|nr:hypothetical protein [Blastocatellia bacterium]